MMGNICSSKAKIAKTYLTNDFLKTALNDKSDALATEQLKLIEAVQDELNDSSKACKARAEEVEKNKLKLLEAVIEGKPTEFLTDKIVESSVKLNKLRDLESQLAICKAKASSVNEILAELVKLDEVQFPVAVPEVVPEEEKEPTYHLTLPEPLELARAAVACLESPNDIIDNIISDLRLKLELALKKTMSELAGPTQ